MDKHRKLWSINSLCGELQRNFRTISKALINVPADGTLNGRPGWLMSTAIAAMRKYEGQSNRFDGRSPASDDGTMVEIDRAAAAVQDMLDRMRAEDDIEKRRQILMADGRAVGALHRAFEFDLAGLGPAENEMFRPWITEQFATITAEVMALCEIQLRNEDAA